MFYFTQITSLFLISKDSVCLKKLPTTGSTTVLQFIGQYAKALEAKIIDTSVKFHMIKCTSFCRYRYKIGCIKSSRKCVQVFSGWKDHVLLLDHRRRRPIYYRIQRHHFSRSYISTLLPNYRSTSFYCLAHCSNVTAVS